MVHNEYVIFYFILHNRHKNKYNIKEVENIFLKIKKDINKFFLYIYMYSCISLQLFFDNEKICKTNIDLLCYKGSVNIMGYNAVVCELIIDFANIDMK